MVRSLIVALPLALAISAPAVSAEDQRQISGALAYRERIALPPEAEFVVEVSSDAGAPLAGLRQAADGRQVPWPFSLAVPVGVAASLDAAIAVDGEPGWASEPVGIEAGDGAVDLGTILLVRRAGAGPRVPFTCGDTTVSAEFVEDGVILRGEGVELMLTQAVSGSGARYVSEDGNTTFWNKGDKATLTLEGKELPECTASAAEQG